MKQIPKLTSFFLIFFFVSSFLAQARRLQENYEDELKKAKLSSITYNGKLPATTGDFLLTLRLELPKSQDSQSFFERFNGVVAYMLTLSSLRSKEFGREAKSPPPSPKPSDPSHPTIIPSGLSSAWEFGREEKSPPPAPEKDIPDHPTIITSSYGREAMSPPPAPETDIPRHPTIIPSRLSSAGEFGREEKSPPPAPQTGIPEHPKITTSSYGRQERSPPPAPKPGPPIHPGNSGGGAQVISRAEDFASFLASA